MENESETTDVTSDYDFDKDADDAEEVNIVHTIVNIGDQTFC